jgi:hypothetical protein
MLRSILYVYKTVGLAVFSYQWLEAVRKQQNNIKVQDMFVTSTLPWNRRKNFPQQSVTALYRLVAHERLSFESPTLAVT